MQKHFLLWVIGFGVFLAGRSFASPELDARYGFRALLAAVVSQGRDNVHEQHVQSVMQKYFKTRPRFELVSHSVLESMRQADNLPKVENLFSAKEDDMVLWLDVARASGADSVLFAQIQHSGDSYQLAFLGAITEPAEIVFRRVVPVADHFTLPSFGQAAEEGLAAFVQALPFDATVLSREGYRVVLDRGAPSFRAGARVPIFTVEKDDAGIVLKETGVVQIQRAEANLAFGTILVENKPAEVLKGNKARFQGMDSLAAADRRSSFRPSGFSRSIASVAEGGSAEGALAEEASNKSGWATFDLDLAGSLVTWNRAAADGRFSSTSGFYPGVALRAQIKLTQNTFVEFNGLAGAASLTAAGRSSQSSQVRFQGGYRVPLGGIVGPSLLFRVGYSRTQFQMDDQPSVLGPSSALFEGLALGAGFVFPLNEKAGVGLEMTALTFPSLKENGGTSGASSKDVTGWDFAVRGYYNLTEKVNLEAKLLFQTHSAGFTGVGTRPITLSSLSQNTRALLTGVSYSF